MDFQKRKASALTAMNSPEPDKSPKGGVDAPIIPLLKAINSHPSYFTTSSCSGRISILSQPTSTSSSGSTTAPKKKAKGGSWLLVSHDPVQPSSLIGMLFPTPTLPNLVFRFEPLIIAVESDSIEAAQSLVSLAISCGFRESGITSVSKRVIIAIRCSIRLEVPLGGELNLMVSPEYVEYLVGVANEKMVANRKRTDMFLNKLLDNGFSGARKISMNGGIERYGIVAEKGGILESAIENGVEVVDEELGSTEEDNQKTDSGLLQEFGINLCNVKIVGESVERLFLWGHSACIAGETRIIIFGGFGGIGRHGRRNDLLLLDTQSGVVETIVSVGAPSPRLGHTSSLVGDFIYVIGGRADPLNILNDVWMFNLPNKEWKLLQCTGNLFPPRHRHTSAAVGSKIYVYGGIHNNTILSSLYVFDTETSLWTEIKILGDQPGPRHSHSMESIGSKLYMYGGYDGDKALGDLYCLDTETGLCNKLITSGKSPNSRFSHLMFIHSNYLGIFGGCPVSERQELFLLNLQSMSWKSIMVKASESLFVRSTVTVVDGELIIIGGGAACYAFGTKFSEPMKINLLQLIPMCDNIAPAVGYQMEEQNGFLLSDQNKSEQEVDACAHLDSEELRENIGGVLMASPFVVRLEKKYAKLGKDILKQFGWLDLERKVYPQDGGEYVCFPVTEVFCTVFDDLQCMEFGTPPDLQSLKPSTWQMMLKDFSRSDALDVLKASGAKKIIAEVIKMKKNPISPFETMKEAVTSLLKHHTLSEDLLEQLPSRWERLGDIVVLPVTSFTDPAWRSVGPDIWPLVAQSLGAQRLAKQNPIAPTGTRDSKLEILVGDNGWVDHRENGILYSFNATKCMFSWGNLSEKLRMAHIKCQDQVIVDLFAGIGYFTLPFLVRGNAKLVYACEWNPHAIEALRRNVHVNNVADQCIVLEGDNRVTAPKGVADRVCLGLLPSSECSWLTAVRALRSNGGILHIHGNVKDTEEETWVNEVAQSISDIAESEGHGWEISVEHVERVKWYAPHIRHTVLDLRCKSSK